MITLEGKNLINTNKNEKIINYDENVSVKCQLNHRRPSFYNTIGQTNNLLNIPSTSKTCLLLKNYDIDLNSNYGTNLLFYNDSPNFSLDLLNSYITELNGDYLEKCKNIFSIVNDKILEVLSQMDTKNKVSNLVKYKTLGAYKCYPKINIALRIILQKIFGKKLDFSICPNKFINLNESDLDIAITKYTEYNIFRT
ncbi:hypothetical protein DMUE_5454 [Dictyocoela muelleri]|nr:hypothetical protein DMUE_5454 [Dictyocoela muelleri]